MRRHHHYRLTKRRFFKNKYKKKYVGCLLGVNCGLAEELLHEPNQVTKDAIEEARIEMTHDKGATMNQLRAWEYEGKTEYGYEISHGLEDTRGFVRVDFLTSALIRSERSITNLRKAKVVDEDAVVLTEVLRAQSYVTSSDGKSVKWWVEGWAKDYDPAPPVTEPKNFGAIVEAKAISQLYIPNNYRITTQPYLWSKGEEKWHLINTHYIAEWSQFINPIIISEGVEG